MSRFNEGDIIFWKDNLAYYNSSELRVLHGKLDVGYHNVFPYSVDDLIEKELDNES